MAEPGEMETVSVPEGAVGAQDEAPIPTPAVEGSERTSSGGGIPAPSSSIPRSSTESGRMPVDRSDAPFTVEEVLSVMEKIRSIRGANAFDMISMTELTSSNNGNLLTVSLFFANIPRLCLANLLNTSLDRAVGTSLPNVAPLSKVSHNGEARS